MIFLIYLLFFLIFPIQISAADYRTDYNIEYYLDPVSSKVKTNIKVTNLTDDIYVKKFILSLPGNFKISSLTASDNIGKIEPALKETGNYYEVSLEFNSPRIGKNSENDLFIEFTQDKLFEVNGNVWEIILPTVENKDGSYNVTAYLPSAIDKPVLISKPKPDLIQKNKIVWSNPTTETLYVIIGEKQYYAANIRYHLKNDRFVPVYTDIALPPDTMHQKTYIKSLNPQPILVFTDPDGNYLARYNLNPRQEKTIVYKGTIELFSKPREALTQTFKWAYFRNKSNLLKTDNKYWNLSGSAPRFTDPAAIYNFVLNKLEYNKDRIGKSIERYGASRILASPTDAVCTEFSDLFVAVARANSIAAREVEGYGFTNDPELRPLSLVSDVLHSWPEYYLEDKEIWVPVDPTWEDTSGIDYFTSLDLNHIVFAIHGTDPEYPYPAGFYKIKNTKDIHIEATKEVPEELKKIKVEKVIIPKTVSKGNSHKGQFRVKNLSNVYLWNIPIETKSDDFEIIKGSTATIETLAPYEGRDIPLELKSKSDSISKSGNIQILVAGDIYNNEIKIAPTYTKYLTKIAIVLGGILTFVFISKKLRFRK